MNRNKIEYKPDALVITLPCSDPAALHSQLMQSIAANMNNFASNPHHPTLPDEISPLINLLRTILPTERHLSRGYEL